MILDTLNTKVDKLIRLLSDLAENSAKLSKNFAEITKKLENNTKAEKPSAAKSVGVFLQNLHKNEEKAKNVAEKATVQRPNVDPLAELKWGLNLYLLGDGIFNMLLSVEDVKGQLDKMKANLHLTIRAKDKATVGSLYDRSRDKFIFAMPPKAKTIVLSIGRVTRFGCFPDLK